MLKSDVPGVVKGSGGLVLTDLQPFRVNIWRTRMENAAPAGGNADVDEMQMWMVIPMQRAAVLLAQVIKSSRAAG